MVFRFCMGCKWQADDIRPCNFTRGFFHGVSTDTVWLPSATVWLYIHGSAGQISRRLLYKEDFRFHCRISSMLTEYVKYISFIFDKVYIILRIINTIY